MWTEGTSTHKNNNNQASLVSPFDKWYIEFSGYKWSEREMIMRADWKSQPSREPFTPQDLYMCTVLCAVVFFPDSCCFATMHFDPFQRDFFFVSLLGFRERFLWIPNGAICIRKRIHFVIFFKTKFGSSNKLEAFFFTELFLMSVKVFRLFNFL